MREMLRSIFAHNAVRVGGLLLVVMFVANPELLSLVSVIAVIGLDAFALLLFWQLRDYFRVAVAYATAALNLPRVRRWWAKSSERDAGNRSD